MSVLTVQGQLIHDTIEDVGAVGGEAKYCMEKSTLFHAILRSRGRGQCWEVTKSTYPMRVLVKPI